MRSERLRGRKFTSRRDLSKKESSSHGDKEKWEKKTDLVCFKCKKSGYIIYDCPLYKSEAKRRMKKTMMTTWSESEESSKEENEILRKKNEWLTFSFSIFFCRQKSFEMILASQKCVFDKQILGFKSKKKIKSISKTIL